MSLSSLQAQLAALHDAPAAGAATAAGSTIASNRRHGESVGRGLEFRAQHGNATTHNSSKYGISLPENIPSGYNPKTNIDWIGRRFVVPSYGIVMVIMLTAGKTKF